MVSALLTATTVLPAFTEADNKARSCRSQNGFDQTDVQCRMAAATSSYTQHAPAPCGAPVLIGYQLEQSTARGGDIPNNPLKDALPDFCVHHPQMLHYS